MNAILTVTDKACNQLEKIIQSAPSDTVGILLGIDKTGCNGHSYKLDYAKKNEQKQIVSEYQNLIDELDLLRTQIVHGVPEKYLELVKIKQIGRVRAQILYKNGYKNKASLKKAPLEKLAAIDKIGIILAKSIKSQVEKVR